MRGARVVLQLVVAPAPGLAVALLLGEFLRYGDPGAEVGPPVDGWVGALVGCLGPGV